MLSPTRLCVLSLICGLGFVSAPASAIDYKYSGEVTFTSDYVWRGASQTDRKPAVQAGYSLNTDIGLNLGVWGSNISFLESPASLELDTFISGTFSVTTDWGVELGYLDYHYPGDSDLNFSELYFNVSGPKFSLSLSSSNDYEALDSSAVWGSASYEFTLLPDILVLGVEYGRVNADRIVFIDAERPGSNSDSFNHASLYLSFLFETFQLKAMYSSSNRPGCGDNCNNVSSLALTKSF